MVINLILGIATFLHLSEVDAACEGSVIFYWKESRDKMKTEQRNWGVLMKELDGSKGILSSLMNTNNTYSFQRMGDCCWEVYSKKFFKGESAPLIPTLPSGYGGIPGYPKFKANSLKKIPC